MDLLPGEILASINRHVYQKFPELEGIQPIQKRVPSSPNVGLVYRRKTVTEDGFSVERIVRATVTPQGHIVKLTTSR